MKRTIKSLIGITLALGSFGIFRGCSQIEKKDLFDGYKFEKPCGIFNDDVSKVVFKHYGVKNIDTLTFYGYDTMPELTRDYIDYNCDGEVDIISMRNSHTQYQKGQERTDDLFVRANEELAEYKREFGVVAEAEIK